MKRKSLLLMLLMAFALPWTAMAQQALPVSNGIQINDTRTSDLIPQTLVAATINDLGTAYNAPRIVNGNRAYCTPSFSYTGTNYGLYINSFVTVSGEPNINNRATSLTEGGYADYYDSYSASIEAGGTLHFAVTPGGAYNPMGYALWVDWNQDEVFGSDERVAVTSTPIQATWIESFVVPSATPEGDYRMRVMLIYATNPGDPCVSTAYGEAEDYKLTVLPGEACPAPTGIHAENITPFTADLMWTSDAGNYQVRYAPHIAESELLQYDNGTLGTTVGYGGTPFYWATMYPAGSYTGSYLSKVTVYDCNEMTGFVMIYNDGTTAPENLVATMHIASTGANSFVDFTFDQLVDLDANKNLWIVFYYCCPLKL